MQYTVTGLLFKKILYECPSCNQPLESKMSEAGNPDSCPICGTRFVVPGAEERLRMEAEEAKRRMDEEMLAEQRRKAEEAEKARRAAAIQQAKQKAEQEARRLQALDDEVYEVLTEPETAQLEGPGDFAIEIVGESHYQDALEAVVHDHGKLVEAVLILEDSNPHDPKAVQVQISDCVCGYLSRENAREYRKKLKEAKHPRLTVRCRAMIVGKGPYGVRLDLPHEGDFQPPDSWRSEPATEAQKEFADDLGIKYGKNITKGELSDLISGETGE